MTKDEALKLALEALERLALPKNADDIFRRAITAIKEALAQQNEFKPDWDEKLALTEEVISLSKRIDELEAQPSVSVEQEPVATDWERIARVQDAKLRAMCNEAGGFEKLCEVMDKYERTTPPQRTWVGLTYEDMVKLQKDLFDAKGESVLPTTFAMAVEAKLKEKNT